MSDKTWLDIVEKPYCYQIAWHDEDDGAGLFLGEEVKDAEHEAACAAAQIIGDPGRDAYGALFWDSLTNAKKALRAAKAAVKASNAKAPWPDWALRAQSEGWKPPKGWKP